MRRLLFLAVFLLPGLALGQESVAKSRVVSVGLFKNGLAVVKRQVTIPKAGTYRLDAAPEPVHGTFWIEGNCQVDAAVKMRDVEVGLHQPLPGDWQEDLAGRKVVVHFRNGKLEPMKGTVIKTVTASTDPSGEGQLPQNGLRYAGSRMLMLKTATGRTYIDSAEIAAVEAEGNEDKVTRRRPVLVLSVEKADKEPLVYVSYLAHGLAWAPSYRIDISDPKTMAIEMASVIRNQLVDLDDAEVRLISGFPSVEFAGVLSPLSPHSTWETFFAQLANPQGANDGGALLRQQVVLANSVITQGHRFKLGAEPAGEGVDLHYEPIGKRTLHRGEALSLIVGQAKASYERIVDWTVGTSTLASNLGSGMRVQDEMWDTIYFKNPFRFPMTTAPATVYEDGKFGGQRTAYWANVGEETRVRVTKALSIRTSSVEEEDPTQKPSQVVVEGHTYTKYPLRGELKLSNHRKEAVKVHVRQQIHGAIQDIDGNPRVTTKETTLTDVNRTHEAGWVVELNPGQERTLTYRYSVLVRR